MPEEGIETQELKEKLEEIQEREGRGAEGARWTMWLSMSTALIAVLAAIAALKSGSYANDATLQKNDAVLHQSKADDAWSYYQAKSTKGHIYEVGREIVTVLAATASDAKASLDRFDQQRSKYIEEKEPIKTKAEKLEKESRHEFEQHHYYSLGIASFQVGIVLASISILVRNRASWWLSLVAGLLGIMFLSRGWFLPP